MAIWPIIVGVGIDLVRVLGVVLSVLGVVLTAPEATKLIVQSVWA
jgi:hypothetical protein